MNAEFGMMNAESGPPPSETLQLCNSATLATIETFHIIHFIFFIHIVQNTVGGNRVMCEYRRVTRVTRHCDAALTFEGGAVRGTETFHAFPAFAMFATFQAFQVFQAFSRTRDALKKQNKRVRVKI
ncbi:MAG: hypothetical protein IPM21_05610 [Acidobacteria bacterium]|nr:hypothetical protein [Acidobacteriota bacterium]